MELSDKKDNPAHPILKWFFILLHGLFALAIFCLAAIFFLPAISNFAEAPKDLAFPVFLLGFGTIFAIRTYNLATGAHLGGGNATYFLSVGIGKLKRVLPVLGAIIIVVGWFPERVAVVFSGYPFATIRPKTELRVFDYVPMDSFQLSSIVFSRGKWVGTISWSTRPYFEPRDGQPTSHLLLSRRYVLWQILLDWIFGICIFIRMPAVILAAGLIARWTAVAHKLSLASRLTCDETEEVSGSGHSMRLQEEHPEEITIIDSDPTTANQDQQPNGPAARWTAAIIYGLFFSFWIWMTYNFIGAAVLSAKEKIWLAVPMHLAIAFLSARVAWKTGHRAYRLAKNQERIPISGGNPGALLFIGFLVALFLFWLYAMGSMDERRRF